MHGSPVPLVWVLVEDDVIPPNAISFGEDKNGPLYIARALLEGGLRKYFLSISKRYRKICSRFGKGRHSPFTREHQVKLYEVLGTVLLAQQNQHLSQPGSAQADGSTLRETWSTHNSRETSSSVGTTLCVNDIPRFMPNLEAVVPSVDGGLKKPIVTSVDGGMKTDILPLFDDGLKKPIIPAVDDDVKRLAGYKTVIMIDDSISMGEEQSWTPVCEALAGITDLMNQYGSQGINLHFLHHHDCHINTKTSQGVQQIFDQMHPDGQDTPTTAKLEELINRYLPLVERKHPQHEPIRIIVITDGVATDNDTFPEIIVSAVHRLERSQVPHEMFRIQFVQVGTDPKAAATLWVLGDRLAMESQIRGRETAINQQCN
ncbi:hypothetical protein M405DRAFT_934418 [Rhizopogon salebrosus TDB-379]|nr:hypothetical protein M405DRAFT_934418 [Rhizopogon salebrosus TDB-379]